MSILIKSATLVDSKSNLNFKKKDILIKNGVITDIADNINAKSDNKLILDNLHVSRGWMDTSVSFGEPGYEERENLSNGLLTAASSGFTSILLNPDCNPLIDNHSSVEFLKKKSLNTTTDIYPIANLTNNSNGSDLASLYDMKLAGAVGFGDYKKSITDSSILKIALEYTKSFGGRVISFCQDEFLSKKGVLNESIVSTELGLKGIPNISESINLFRDIELLNYTGGKIHIPYVTTAKGVQLIREAKKKNLDVTASVSIAHINFSEIRENVGSATLNEMREPEYNEKKEKVKVEKLDSLYQFTNKNLFIKIDVEGHEKEVLDGSINILRNNKILMYLETSNDNLLNLSLDFFLEPSLQ